ncbi:alpha-2-glucosyltransferase Alg10 [Cunninghamella echinulata]|nr:alpha-2-glucosyltransferase Alg10 [Cunninghamella echinulata]
MPSALFIHTVSLAVITNVVNKVVTTPYMDEIFHVPQAQRYCYGDYTTWDPKLTTPPGLYVISIGLKAIGDIFDYKNLCTLQTLRVTNTLIAFLLYLTIFKICTTIHPTISSQRLSYYALILSSFPVLFFYYSLYYTDAGSTLFVLLSYLGVKSNRYFLAGLMGAVAVTFRQTNIIWVFYFMILSIIQLIQSRTKQKNTSKTASTLYNPICNRVHLPSDIFQSIFSFIKYTMINFFYILPRILTFVLTLIAFGIFLLWNGSIVLGDKSNHMAGIHIPQLFYFTSFLSFFTAPLYLHWKHGSDLLRCIYYSNIKRILTLICFLLFMYYAVDFHTYEHPFLLSDNRHYSFYVWKNIYRRHWSIKYALIPAYAISIFININILGPNISILWMFGYIMTLILTLVPSPLLEFRYFILPLLFYCLHIPPPKNNLRILITFVFYTAINSITLYIFLYHPFLWPQEPNQSQRFMW